MNKYKSAAEKFVTLLLIMERLRQNCPWDRQQTNASLRRYILEEAYETIDKIDHQDWHGLAQELGDQLLQIIFQSAIAQEKGYFNIETVIDHISPFCQVRRDRPVSWGFRYGRPIRVFGPNFICPLG